MVDLAPDFELIVVLVARLKADAIVAGYVADRVYDRVPETKEGKPRVPYPYISFGSSEQTPDDYDCIDGEEVAVQIDVWSNGDGEAYGSAEVRKIARAVKKSIHEAEISMTTNALVTVRHERTRTLRESGAINHAAVQFTATVETPS